jgi:hypothetical protein
MKRLAFLSFTIATLIAPIQVQAQTGCVTFPQKPNPEAEVRFLISHPGARVCPGVTQNPEEEIQRQRNIGKILRGWCGNRPC